MTRRMLAAISVLALATVTTVAPLALFPGTATAQNPNYILSLTDANGPPGGFVDVQVLFDNTGDDVQGWSFGVAHVPSMATLIEVVDGITTATANNGGPPDFNQVNVIPGSGFTAGVVICFDPFLGCAVIPGGSLNNELYIATYRLNASGAPGTGSQVEFVDTIGSPPVETIVVVNGSSLFPTTEDGTISIIDCTNTPSPPTNLTCVIEIDSNCLCQALLEWQPTPSPIVYYEIYVDGLLATTVSQGATSAVIPLPSSGPSEICIRAGCQDLFSPLVCCTVECQPDFDCNNNGVPDLCDIAQGGHDCNGNGELDECEIATGSVPDCNSNGVPDECDAGTTEPDCNLNNIPDVCEIADGSEFDCDLDGVPDSCKSGPFFDCNNNGIPDECDYNNGTSFDCNNNGFLDDCDILLGVSEDCDENGIPDECDIAAGAADADGDGIPDVCAGQNFIRGECNGDDSISIADAIFLLGFLFNSGPAPTCQDACDINDDSGIDIGDGVYLLAYLFSGAAAPPAPFPDCGIDPTADALECDAFAACP